MERKNFDVVRWLFLMPKFLFLLWRFLYFLFLLKTMISIANSPSSSPPRFFYSCFLPIKETSLFRNQILLLFFLSMSSLRSFSSEWSEQIEEKNDLITRVDKQIFTERCFVFEDEKHNNDDEEENVSSILNEKKITMINKNHWIENIDHNQRISH